MRIAYLDCISGISGDMTLGALVDAGVDLEAIRTGVASLGLTDCRLVATEVKKKGFRATQITVEHPPEHAHRHLHHIVEMIRGSELTDDQQQLAVDIFTRLGEAEAKVHGTTIEKVHFHEVGAVDSIADIVGAAIGWNLLGVERIVASPVPTGTGTIEIAHGRCSIPAPATAELLRGIPLRETDIACELTTPTGAAILSVLAESYGPLPSMSIEAIGYGSGERDLDAQANVLRLLVGETTGADVCDTVYVLETNLDNTTGEAIGHTTGRLMDAGALDAFTSAIQMKKNRPGTLLTVLCGAERITAMEDIIFTETATLGIRRTRADRRKLQRESCEVETALGTVRGKVRTLPSGRRAFSPEYEDCQRVAREQHVALAEVYRVASAAYEPDETSRDSGSA